MAENTPREDAEAIFLAGLRSVDPTIIMRRVLSLSGDMFIVTTERETVSYDLRNFDRILVMGMGKATARMALGLEGILGNRITDGVISVKKGHVENLRRVRIIEAGHPIPDESSLRAAGQILELAARADTRTLVITLISGGGSALVCAPYRSRSHCISLEEKKDVTRQLLASGATIQEVNCIRKHLSTIKGGRLTAAYEPATSLNLILSDVVGDDFDAIASGPTAPDPTTFADALSIMGKYQLEERVPHAAMNLLRAGAAGEESDTPKECDPVFTKGANILIGTNYQALQSAEKEAQALGYRTLLLTSRLTGEAREAALFLHGIGTDIATRGFPLQPPACVIVGGETTVKLRGAGKGGRNQEMALAFLASLARSPKCHRRITFLAASTDGNDGPTDAAGAFASVELLERSREAGLDPDDFLAVNDSYTFFERAGGHLKTGPTNTNVSDIQMVLIA